MNININNRLVLIVGPSTTGKTTLSKRIKKEANVKSIIISHDEVLEKINKNQSQEQLDLNFRLTLIKEIAEAINDNSNELIILDTVNVDSKALLAVLLIIRMLINYTGGITLLKMNPPLELHKRYIFERAKTNSSIRFEPILSQVNHYNSNQGSLYKSYDLADEEFIIQNPEDIVLDFGTKDAPRLL